MVNFSGRYVGSVFENSSSHWSGAINGGDTFYP